MDSTLTTQTIVVNTETSNATFVLPGERSEQGKEFQTELKLYLIDMQCPKCKSGWMRGTGHGITTLSTSWKNRCSSCQYEAWYEDSYPTQITKIVGKRQSLSPGVNEAQRDDEKKEKASLDDQRERE